VVQKNRLLTSSQFAEFQAFLRSGSSATEKDIAYLLSPAIQRQAYLDWKNEVPLRLPGQATLYNGVMYRFRKYVPRGPGVKPKKQLVNVRLDAGQLEALKGLGGSVSEHIRLAVQAYLDSKP
jgi:hypothetical protein